MSGGWGVRRDHDDHTFLEAGIGQKSTQNEPVMDMETILDLCNVLSVQDFVKFKLQVWGRWRGGLYQG